MSEPLCPKCNSIYCKCSPQKDRFTQGFFCALAILADDYDQPSMAVGICRTSGMGLKHLKDIDEYDKKKLKDVIKDLRRKP